MPGEPGVNTHNMKKKRNAAREVTNGCRLMAGVFMAGGNYTEPPLIGNTESSPFVGWPTGDILSDKVMENMPLEVCEFPLTGFWCWRWKLAGFGCGHRSFQ